MSCYIYKIIKASRKPENVLNMEFPFKDGKYLITDGGDGYLCSLMNYHYKSSTHNQHKTQDSMRYAVDIVKMGSYSRTISRLVAFGDNSDYVIFHETIFSPIDGIVVKVQDGVNNNKPFPGKGKLPYNVGNYVVIKNEDYYVIMGHMEQGSILIKEGDYIHVGDKIGLVGNSGLTPRSHLHLQVSKCKDGNYWTAEGVPVLFNQKFYPVKNRVINV
jgi:Membrane proteins related to metalloendopeptidases